LDPRTLQPSRSVYVGNLPPTVSVSELCDLATPFGLLESMRFMPSSTYAFLNFARQNDAQRFWECGQSVGVSLRGNRLFTNWAKAPPLDPQVMRFVESGATRHLLVENISLQTPQQQLQTIFKQFGEIEKIVLQPERNAALVNFTSITSAVAAKDAIHGLSMGDAMGTRLQLSFTRPPGVPA